jgi:hypothetical protein
MWQNEQCQIREKIFSVAGIEGKADSPTSSRRSKSLYIDDKKRLTDLEFSANTPPRLVSHFSGDSLDF